MDIGKLSTPKQPLTGSEDARLEAARRAAQSGNSEETARQFETLFGVMLVRELRRAIPKGVFGQGAGADVYEGWFDEHLGRALGERDALGIAELVRASLLRKAAAADAEAPDVLVPDIQPPDLQPRKVQPSDTQGETTR